MDEQNIRDEFRKAIIMGNYPGMTYEEALDVEVKELMNGTADSVDIDDCFPLTIGRVLQAFQNKNRKEFIRLDDRGNITLDHYDDKKCICRWQLTKEGKECDADMQDINTIKSLLQLLK